MARKTAHGGRRAGAGRKPILGNGTLKTYSLTAGHVQAVKDWAADHDMTESAAVRYFIERITGYRPPKGGETKT